MSTRASFEDFTARCSILADRIAVRRDALLDALTSYESHLVAHDEFARSTDCLRNARLEAPTHHPELRRISTFFPVNLPLYSLVLFGIMPSFYSNEVIVRPPVLMRRVLHDVMEVLDLPTLFDAVRCVAMERAAFLRDFAAQSEVVIFTGTYSNAVRVRDTLPKDCVFIYNGAGVNPLLVLPDADIEETVPKIVEVKAFNSGQDCAGPDAILVPGTLLANLVERLAAEVERLPIGDYRNPAVRIGPLIDPNHVHFVGRELAQHREWLRAGGLIDFRRGIVHPAIIVRHVSDYPNYTECFAPIFFVNAYDTMADVAGYFSDTRYTEHAMYVSVFGRIVPDNLFGRSIVLRNQTILDVERGNREFGGFGARASFVAVGRRVESKPILISRDIQQFARRRT